MNSSLDYYLLYTASIVSSTFWVVIWIMHVCAITNAKLKLNKRSYTSAASRRKRKLTKLKHLKEKFLDPVKNNYYNYYYHEKEKENENKNNTASTNNKSPLCSPPAFAAPNQHAVNITTTTTTTTPSNTSINQQINSFTNYFNCPVSKTTTIKSSDITINNNTHTHRHHSQPSHSINLYDDFPPFINHLPLPGVSIIKPLVGIDTNLYENLETFFQIDYPIYELLFCVQDPNDNAILLVRNLLKTYPNVDAKLFTGGERVGVNPKINNMQPAYKAVKYELILVSDSGISMKKDTLLDMVSHMHDDVALVHQMPFVCDSSRQNFQTIVEKVYFGTAHARAYLTADLLNINCPTGMSALMRKQLLDEVGGIKAFGQYLAEDFFFAKSFTERGWKISISSQPAWQNSANSSDKLTTLSCRIERWIKLRLAMVPQWTLLEPFSECMLLGFLGAISCSFLWAFNPFLVFIFHIILWSICDYNLLCIIQNGPLTFSKTDFIVAWLIRECTALIIFLKALSNPKVTWRSRIFKLKWGGHAEEIFPGEIENQKIKDESGPTIATETTTNSTTITPTITKTKQHCHENEANLLCALNLYYVTC